MADELTVQAHTPSVGSEAARTTQVKADGARSAAASAVDQLRALVQRRFGRVITVEVAELLRERIKTKRAEVQRLAESKTAFETQHTKEKIGPANAEMQARQVVGTAGTRGADGLDEKARAAVRGDPKAGPQLPPTDAKAPNSQLAAQIAGKMLQFVLLDDHPVDLASYAAGVREARAGASGADTKEGGARAKLRGPGFATGGASPGTAKGQAFGADTLMSRGPGAAALPRPGAVSSGEGKTAAAKGTGSSSLALPKSQPGLVGGQHQTAGGQLVNRGGGLVSSTPFDGMHFNWDAFFVRFMIESVEDLGFWRRMMRQIRDRAAENSQLARRVELTGLEWEHDFDVLFARLDLTKDILAAASSYRRGKDMADDRTRAVEAAKQAEKDAGTQAATAEKALKEAEKGLGPASEEAKKAKVEADSAKAKAEESAKHAAEKKAELEAAKKKGDKEVVSKLQGEAEALEKKSVEAKQNAEKAVKDFDAKQAALAAPTQKHEQAKQNKALADDWLAKATEARQAAEEDKLAYGRSDTAGKAEYVQDVAVQKRAPARGAEAKAKAAAYAQHGSEFKETQAGKSAAELEKNQSEFQANPETKRLREDAQKADMEARTAEAQAPKEAHYGPRSIPVLSFRTLHSVIGTAASSIKQHLGTADAHYAQAHNEILQQLIASPDETRRRVEQLKRRTTAEAQGMLDQLMAVYKSGRVV